MVSKSLAEFFFSVAYTVFFYGPFYIFRLSQRAGGGARAPWPPLNRPLKYLFHELIRNTGVSYHVVESISFNGKRIAMVKDGALDLIYRGGLSRNFTRTDHFHIKLSNCLLYSTDMRDSSGAARNTSSLHLHC